MKRLYLASITVFGIGLIQLQASWTLESTIAYALENNPDIQIASESIEAAASKIDQAKAAFRPMVNLESTYTRTNIPLYAFGSILNQGVFDFGLDFNNPGEIDNLNVTGSVMYSLYQGGVRNANLEAAKSAHLASEYQMQATDQQVKFSVIQAWNQIIQAKDHVKSQESNLNAFTKSLDLARRQFEAGKFLKIEVLNLEVQVARAKEGLVNAQHSLELAREALLNLLGTDDSTILDNIDPQAPEQNQPIDPSTLTPQDRAEVLAMRQQVAAAERNLDAVESGNSPQVNAFANYQYNHGFEYDGSGDHWMAGVALNYNIYGGGLTENRIREAKAMLRKARSGLRKLELAIELDKRSAAIGYSNAIEAAEVTSKMVQTAEESAKLSRNRFESGVILSSELIDVENRLTEARMHRAFAITQVATAEANLKRAYGYL